MNEAWKTRSGEVDNSQVREQGDDLSALQRKRGQSRNRPMVEEAANREAEQRKQRLKRKAQIGKAKELLARPKAWIPLAVITGLAVLWLLLGGFVRDRLSPPLSLPSLEQNSNQLQLRAESRLGAPARRVKVEEFGDRFEVSFRVKAGTKRFAGGRVGSSCLLVLSIDRHSDPQQLKTEVVKQRGC